MGGSSWGYKGGLLGAVPLKREPPGFFCRGFCCGFLWSVSVCLSVSLSVGPFVWACLCLSAFVCVWLCLPVCVCVSVSVCVCLGPSVSVCTCSAYLLLFLISRNTLCDVFLPLCFHWGHCCGASALSIRLEASKSEYYAKFFLWLIYI